jgi:hypothetical protein
VISLVPAGCATVAQVTPASSLRYNPAFVRTNSAPLDGVKTRSIRSSTGPSASQPGIWSALVLPAGPIHGPMAIVATNNGTAIQTDERRPIMVVVPETWSEESEDPDHQKSLLFCTVTSDRTRCVQEQS